MALGMSLRQPSGDVLRGQDPDKNSGVTRVSHPELPSIPFPGLDSAPAEPQIHPASPPLAE